MNLFEIYLKIIKKVLLKNKSKIKFKNKEDLENIVVENPPIAYDFDLSSNLALVLAKKVKDNPRNVAEKIKNIIINDINDFSSIEVAGPGFLNFKLNDKAWIKVINNIYNKRKFFGSNMKAKKYNIEFVSANPNRTTSCGSL